VPQEGYTIAVVTCPKFSDERLRNVERRINAHYLQLGKSKSLNTRAELEMAAFAEP
jgi:hypothetical protein